MFVTWQTVITAASVITALAVMLKNYNKGYDMVRHQSEQDREIQELREQQEKDAKRLNERRAEDKRQMNAELQLLTYGILACLKGLQEQGCDGDVTAAINRFEKHLNEKAHS